jgi:hypothetical protein
LIGGIAMGKYLMPGTALAGERTPDEIRKMVATLNLSAPAIRVPEKVFIRRRSCTRGCVIA